MGGNPNKYQFVGLIKKPKTTGGSGGKEGDPIQWYARPKPRHAKWSVRLVHVNKDAIIKDLFDQGKIDIFAKYTNTGRSGGLEGEAVEGSAQPTERQVGQYSFGGDLCRTEVHCIIQFCRL